MFRSIIISCCLTLVALASRAQTDSLGTLPRYNAYQIYLTKPALEIKQLLYEKDCTPIKGTISDNKKGIIMEGYEPGNKVHVIVIYMDGTEDEFVRSPCFIDPVIL
jgi:hypothetical protein